MDKDNGAGEGLSMREGRLAGQGRAMREKWGQL